MSLTEQTIEIYRGERIVLPFTFVPDENIAGQILYFTVSKTVNATTKLIGPLLMTITNPGTPATCQVILTEELTDIKPGSYRFDVWRTDEGFESAKAIGAFTVLGNSRVPPIEVV